MKQILNDLYWDTIADLEKIKKSKLLLSERVALEKAILRLETMKKILNNSTISTNQ